MGEALASPLHATPKEKLRGMTHYVPRNDRLLFSKLSFSYIHWLLI
jgi:hypothetical protein